MASIGFDKAAEESSSFFFFFLKESSSFAQIGHLPLQVHHFTKCITEKRKRKEKNPNFGGFI